MNDRNLYRFPGCENLRLDCISDFVSVILSGRINDTNYCLYEARRSGKIRSLFEKLSVAPSPSPQSRKAFYSMWATQGLWIREDRTIDDYLPAVLANFRLEYNGPPIEAFRGERGSNHQAAKYGPSWTTKRSAAAVFARGLNRCPQTGGVLLRTIAPVEAILAAGFSHLGEEHEVILDRRRLAQIEVLEVFVASDDC